MPTARAFAGASEAGGKIFVIGGFDGEMTLNVNESYSPVLDHDGEAAWESKSPMPENKSGLGVINVTDSLIVLGGDPASEYASYYRYLPQQDQWEQIDVIDIGEKFGFAMLESRVHIFGGIYGDDIVQQHKVLPFTYSALFPIIR
jgi:kelch-like protein 18